MTISCEAVILSCCLVMVFAANVVQRTCAVVVKYDNLGHAKPQVMIYPLQDIWIVLHDSTYPDSRACAKQENFVCPKTAMHTLKYHLLRFLQGPDGWHHGFQRSLQPGAVVAMIATFETWWVMASSETS